MSSYIVSEYAKPKHNLKHSTNSRMETWKDMPNMAMNADLSLANSAFTFFPPSSG